MNVKYIKPISAALLLFCLMARPQSITAQVAASDSLLTEVTLQSAIDYALKNQPRIRQSVIDEQITEQNIKTRLADWYPQVNFGYSYQHNFILQTTIIGGNQIKLGVDNTSSAAFSASQVLFNRDVLLARRTKNDVQLQSRQTTVNNKIELTVNVTKAFYDVLTTAQQIKVAQENITRTERSLKDATAQYNAGLTDKIDYKRATISLNNIRATKRTNEQLVEAKLQYLKSLMSYPDSARLNIIYDSAALEREVFLDTLQAPDYTSRIEYKILETQQRLLKNNVQYAKWSYLPTLSANAAYNFNYLNDNVGKLYGNNFPNSFAGLTLAVPIFQGGKRKYSIKTAELQLDRNMLDIIAVRNTINAQYAQSIAGYKSAYINYTTLKENVLLATEVYDVVMLQYRNGIKAYLEVVTAEADLRTAQINYFNALYQVLANKADVQRALGQIVY